LAERGLLSQGLIERVELADEEVFMEQIREAEGFMIL
jgi:hypothetical protein